MSKYIDHSQYPHFGVSIRTVINTQGVTQASIARKLGISRQRLGKILESRDIKGHLLLSICEAVCCSLNDIMEMEILDPVSTPVTNEKDLIDYFEGKKTSHNLNAQGRYNLSLNSEAAEIFWRAKAFKIKEVGIELSHSQALALILNEWSDNGKI